MAETVNLSPDDVQALAAAALTRAGANAAGAASVARAVAAAEMDGIASHGLRYVPIYCEHVGCGKVIGDAVPQLERHSSVGFTADAGCGFAHPAIDRGFEALLPAAQEHGIAGLAVRNSYNCGVLGTHTSRLAAAGLVGLGFTNAPASIAPVGGHQAVIGTNPYSLAVPEAGEAALLIDQSASVVAKSEVMARARSGEQLPEGWAKDANGNPTTDPQAALGGTMMPSGGYKGVGNGMMVEVFAAALSGATLGIHASPFSGTQGGPPRTGQFFLAIAPEPFSGGAFHSRMADLLAAIAAQPGCRIPGQRRQENRARAATAGINIARELYDRVVAWT